MGELKNKSKKRGSINLFLIFLLLTFPISQNFSQELKLENPFRFYTNSLLNKNTLESHQIDFLKLPDKVFSLNKQTTEENPILIDSIITHSIYDSKSKLTFTYDDSGKIVSYLVLYLYNGSWENDRKIVYEYDSVGNIISTLYESWNGNSWNNDINEIFTYDSLGNNTIQLFQHWIDDKWENYFIIYNTYDSNENIILSITQRWTDSLWVNESKTTNSYSSDGLRDSSFFYLWGTDNWGSYWLQTFRYNNNTDLVSILTKIWDRNKWKNYAIVKLTYEIGEPQITGGILLWDGYSWVNYVRNSYSFNEDGYFTHGIYESWENESWVPGEGSIDISNPDGFELNLLAHEAFVYYNVTTDVKKENNSNPKESVLSQNYPNPFNPSTKIKYTIKTPPVSSPLIKGRTKEGFITLKVYDVLGNEVATLVDEEKPAGVYDVEFNGDQLPSGVYFYKLVIGDYSETKKMLLLK